MANFLTTEDTHPGMFKLPKLAVPQNKPADNTSCDEIKYQPSRKFNSFPNQPSFLDKL